MKLHRHLGISYNAAWRMKHKLMQGMVERDRQHPLAGRIELDDAYLGGQRSGGKTGRGAPGKTPFVAAVETNDRGHPQRMKLTVVNGFRSVELAAWARQHLCEGSRVLSDGLACFHAVTDARCSHDRVVTGGRACQCAASRVSLGQYDSGERQERASQHVSLLSPQVCTALPLGVRISVQSPVSSARTHSQACLRGAQNSADAGKAAQTRRSLSGNQERRCGRDPHGRRTRRPWTGPSRSQICPKMFM